jgi:hypothetical protein
MKAFFRTFLILTVLFTFVHCGPTPTHDSNKLLASTVYLVGYHSNPNRLAKTVNALKGLGKERALLALRDYVNGPIDFIRNQDVQIICRILFNKPTGWKPPMLGAASPETRFDGESRFPQFPVAFSEGIPFVLVNGYSSGGGPGDLAINIIQECEHLTMIETDLPLCSNKDAVRAAELLISGDTFKYLYVNNDATKSASSFVLWQANHSGN